jgi:hypothetical protein
MGIIKVKRKSEYANLIRDYKILLDGKPIGTIADGETKEFNIEDGKHTLRATIDWCSSQDIVVYSDQGKTLNITVGSFRSAKWMFPFSGLILGLHFVLMQFGFDYTVFLLYPIFFVLLYYISVGRKKYLSLEEI